MNAAALVTSAIRFKRTNQNRAFRHLKRTRRFVDFLTRDKRVGHKAEQQLIVLVAAFIGSFKAGC